VAGGAVVESEREEAEAGAMMGEVEAREVGRRAEASGAVLASVSPLCMDRATPPLAATPVRMVRMTREVDARPIMVG
jgi:hypothetical protein